MVAHEVSLRDMFTGGGSLFTLGFRAVTALQAMGFAYFGQRPFDPVYDKEKNKNKKKSHFTAQLAQRWGNWPRARFGFAHTCVLSALLRY